MLSEKDKNNLFGGKRGMLAFLQKQRTLNRLDAFLKEVDNILDTYKGVDFDNVFQTAFLQNSRILFEEQMWSQAVDSYLLEMFDKQQSDVRIKFNSIISQNAVSGYAQTRSRLEVKRKVLMTLRTDIKDL